LPTPNWHPTIDKTVTLTIFEAATTGKISRSSACWRALQLVIAYAEDGFGARAGCSFGHYDVADMCQNGRAQLPLKNGQSRALSLRFIAGHVKIVKLLSISGRSNVREQAVILPSAAG
jgi:hypothetical protein